MQERRGRKHSRMNGQGRVQSSSDIRSVDRGILLWRRLWVCPLPWVAEARDDSCAYRVGSWIFFLNRIWISATNRRGKRQFPSFLVNIFMRNKGQIVWKQIALPLFLCYAVTFLERNNHTSGGAKGAGINSCFIWWMSRALLKVKSLSSQF